MVTVRKLVRMECAHHIPNHPGKCRFPHGHSYVIEVFVKQQGVDMETGMAIDFFTMKEHINEVIVDKCDHQDLNQVYPGMLTTAENLATLWLAQLNGKDPRYVRVRVHETATGYAEAEV